MYIPVVVGLALLLLMVVFRSILVPLKAAAGFLLSIAASLGVTVWIFQDGNLNGLFDVASAGPIVSFLPILLIGILFGLAMDYEVFLVSRMRERFVHAVTPRTRSSGLHRQRPRGDRGGHDHDGRLRRLHPVPDDPIIKSIGLSLAFGILADAFLVRLTLVPAVMALLGRRAWWMPQARRAAWCRTSTSRGRAWPGCRVDVPQRPVDFGRRAASAFNCKRPPIPTGRGPRVRTTARHDPPNRRRRPRRRHRRRPRRHDRHRGRTRRRRVRGIAAARRRPRGQPHLPPPAHRATPGPLRMLGFLARLPLRALMVRTPRPHPTRSRPARRPRSRRTHSPRASSQRGRSISPRRRYRLPRPRRRRRVHARRRRPVRAFVRPASLARAPTRADPDRQRPRVRPRRAPDRRIRDGRRAARAATRHN